MGCFWDHILCMKNLTQNLSRIAFIDFEASGLNDHSWPLEIGLSWIEDDLEISTWSSLICPHQSWSDSGWSNQCAGIHGISKEELLDAPDVRKVSEWFHEILDGRIPLGDAQPYDQFWSNRLTEAAGRGGSSMIEHFDSHTNYNFNGIALDHVYKYLATHKAPHRAVSNTDRMARSWIKGIEEAQPGPAPQKLAKVRSSAMSNFIPAGINS
jgi:DNA polymerase-3 subunit epsilon